MNKFGKPAVSYWFNNTNPKKGKIGWVQVSGYGGSFTENVVQATAYDILTDALVRLRKVGIPVVMHIHDEIVTEVRRGTLSAVELERIMVEKSEWYRDWPIRADGGYVAGRFKK